MKKITIISLSFLFFNFGFSQSTDNYIVNYKLINLEEDLSFFEKLIWKEGLQYAFFSNKNVCFLTDFQIKTPVNVNMKVDTTGPMNVYVNYQNEKFYYDLNGETAYHFKKIEFEKTEPGETKFMGFTVTQYKSTDGNIEVLTTKELPWYVQPSAVTNNRFDGAILKIINHKKERAVVFTDYKQIAEIPDKYKGTIKKIKKHPATKVKTIDSPFMALTKEEEEKERVE